MLSLIKNKVKEGVKTTYREKIIVRTPETDNAYGDHFIDKLPITNIEIR